MKQAQERAGQLVRKSVHVRNSECVQGRKGAPVRKAALKKEGEGVQESEHEGIRMSDSEVSRKGARA